MVTNTKVIQISDNEKEKTYIDPEMAEIIIDQIAALKERMALAEEQLKLLMVEDTE